MSKISLSRKCNKLLNTQMIKSDLSSYARYVYAILIVSMLFFLYNQKYLLEIMAC